MGKRHGRSSGMRLGWRSSSSGVRSAVRPSVQGPVGEVPATAPFSSPLHHRYRRWMGGVSRPHSFFSLCGMSKFDIDRTVPVGTKKARHQAEHTCSSALRHWYRRPPEPHLLLIVLSGLRQRGFEPPSSGQQPAAQPLRYMAQKLALCLSDLRNETFGLNSSNQRLGLRPPHSNGA